MENGVSVAILFQAYRDNSQSCDEAAHIEVVAWLGQREWTIALRCVRSCVFCDPRIKEHFTHNLSTQEEKKWLKAGPKLLDRAEQELQRSRLLRKQSGDGGEKTHHARPSPNPNQKTALPGAQPIVAVVHMRSTLSNSTAVGRRLLAAVYHKCIWRRSLP